jgi:hypothetical protein
MSKGPVKHTVGVSLFMWLSLIACAGGVHTGDKDTGPDTDTDPDTEYTPCEALSLQIDGPTEPQVNDEWFVLMKCDGATLLGPYVLQFSDVDFAMIEDNSVTFVQVGTSTMTVRVGSHRIDQAVTVSEAEATNE